MLTGQSQGIAPTKYQKFAGGYLNGRRIGFENKVPENVIWITIFL